MLLVYIIILYYTWYFTYIFYRAGSTSQFTFTLFFHCHWFSVSTSDIAISVIMQPVLEFRFLALFQSTEDMQSQSFYESSNMNFVNILKAL